MRFFARRVGRSSMWLALAVSSAAILSGCKAEAVDPRVDPPFVRTTLAAPSSPAGTRYAGVVVAKIESALAFQVAGKIVERLVATGDMVRKGQPLMRLDPRDYELAKVAADSAVTAARARAVQARADEARARSLVGTGAVSRTAYDQTKAAADTADAHLAQAEARARVARNEADYTTLLAGANGVIVETLAEPGQVVTAGQPVVRMAMAGPREARVALPESRLPPVGTVAQATIFASGSEHPAKLRQISGQADPQTRTFDARFTLSGEAAAAPLGASLTIEVPAQDKARQILVPLGAVTDRGGGPGVWVIVNHSAHSSEQPTVAWRPVSIGAVGAEKATVTRGLAAGERVVTMGAHLLHDGEKVRVDSAASSRADR